MRDPHGYAVLIDPRYDREIEIDTFMCGHCNAHTHIKPGQKPEEMGGYCPNCDGFLCANCAGKRECKPLMKWVEEMEARDRFRRDLG